MLKGEIRHLLLPQKCTINIGQLHHKKLTSTTPDLHITAGFVRTGNDVPSLPVMSMKMKKMIGVGLKSAVKDHITAGLWLEPAVFWRPLITAGLSQEPTVGMKTDQIRTDITHIIFVFIFLFGFGFGHG